MSDKILSRMIIEIMGRPPEHIKEALNTLVVRMVSEKGVKIKDKNYHKPKKIKDADNLYTAFAELEIEFDDLISFFRIILGYLPSHVEIIYPEKFKMSGYEINELSNYIIEKLHKYDALAKRLLAERNILMNQIKGKGQTPAVKNFEKEQTQTKSK